MSHGAAHTVRLVARNRSDRGADLELEEVLSLSDRILVLYEGEIVAEFPPDVSEEEIGMAMVGGRQREAA